MDNLTTREPQLRTNLKTGETTDKIIPAKPIILTPASVAKFLCWIAGVLIAIHIFITINKKFIHQENELTITLDGYFNVGRETTIPTFFLSLF